MSIESTFIPFEKLLIKEEQYYATTVKTQNFSDNYQSPSCQFSHLFGAISQIRPIIVPSYMFRFIVGYSKITRQPKLLVMVSISSTVRKKSDSKSLTTIQQTSR